MKPTYTSRYQAGAAVRPGGVRPASERVTRTGLLRGFGTNLTPEERVASIVAEMESPEIQEILAFSWNAAIRAVTKIARDMGGSLSATEAAHLLSPYWEIGKRRGLQGRQLFNYVVENVTNDLPIYLPRRAAALAEEYPIPPSPQAFKFVESPLYEAPVGRITPQRVSPRVRYGARPPGAPPQLRLRPGERLPFYQ